MRVLLTRPREDSERLAAILRQRGHEVVVSPLMEVRFLDGSALDLAGVQAILATSANGIRALGRRTAVRDLPVFAVGPQTAEEARSLGFASVRDAQGDSLALAKAVAKWASPDGGILLHPTGNIHTPSLSAELSTQKFRMRTEILYEAVEAVTLSEEAVTQLRAEAIDAVMLFSPRSAKLFAAALERAGLGDATKWVRAVCISRAATESLSSLELRAMAIATAPNQDSMIALLETFT